MTLVAGIAPNTTQTRARAPRTPTVLETRVVTGTGGGPDKTILNTPRFIDPLGYRTLCAFFHPPGDPGFESIRAKAAQAGAPLISIPDRGPFDLGVVRRLVEVCRREQVDIWHGHDYKSNALGLIARRFHPMRLITTVHGWARHTSRTPLYYGIDRWCLKRYERVLCVSSDLYEECLRGGVPESRCVLVENGIILSQYERRRTPADARRQLGLREDGLLIAAVGRLSAEKNFPMLIRAVDRLIERGLDVSLAIAGNGSEQEALERLIARKSRTGRIRLLGFLADPRTLYEASDVYALTSDREGLPNVLLEAMALRVPVVSTRVAGVPRLIEHEQNGLLTDCQDEEALVAVLARLLSDEALRSRLGSAGRETIEARYSFEARIERVAGIYESLLEGTQPTV